MNINNGDLDKARQVIAIIEKDYHKSFTVTDLAQMVGTNKSTLNHACREITGMPVKKFIRHFRIETAKHLLINTAHAVEVIAGKVGWDHSNLDKQFKRGTGRTPKEWRMNPD